MKRLATAVLLMWSYNLLAQNQLSELVVRVENVKEKKGQLMVGLFNDKSQFLKEAVVAEQKAADQSVVTLSFKGIESGIYAISLFHDKNQNGKLDSNFFGIPNEPYAFSNNAKGLFGPPAFEQCQFEVGAGKKEIVISL